MKEEHNSTAAYANNKPCQRTSTRTALSAFELQICLSWRVDFNLFSYSFTLSSVPVTPFSRLIFIAIFYPSKRKERKMKGGWKEKKGELKCHQERGGGEILYRFPSFMFEWIKVDCLNAASRKLLLSHKTLC